jgi:hypothetical protein
MKYWRQARSNLALGVGRPPAIAGGFALAFLRSKNAIDVLKIHLYCFFATRLWLAFAPYTPVAVKRTV